MDINQELAINKAIDRISNIFTETSIHLNNGGEWKFKPIELIGDDNSGGYWATTELLGFVNFYNTLNDENKKSLENKLYKKLNLTINKIEDLVDNPNDGGDWTPEYAKQWINSLYESVKTKSINKYVKAFRESCKKLEEKGDFRKWNWNDIPPESYTEKQSYAIKEFDDLLKQIQEGLITRKEFLQRADILYNDLPDYDWTRDKDAKLPNTLFPESCKKLEEENAATKHFRGDTESNRQGWGKSNLISDANEIFASIEHFLTEYDTMLNSQEYKTNSQAARVYKMIEKMRDIIPYTYGADAYNSDMGNKDLVDPIYDNEGDVITAKWRY